jgi:hypothetical protein
VCKNRKTAVQNQEESRKGERKKSTLRKQNQIEIQIKFKMKMRELCSNQVFCMGNV